MDKYATKCAICVFRSMSDDRIRQDVNKNGSEDICLIILIAVVSFFLCLFTFFIGKLSL